MVILIIYNVPTRHKNRESTFPQFKLPHLLCFNTLSQCIRAADEENKR